MERQTNYSHRKLKVCVIKPNDLRWLSNFLRDKLLINASAG